MGVETVASKANCALRNDAGQYGALFPPSLSKNAETASTTRTTARLITATVLALTAMHAALRAASLDHLVGAEQERLRDR